MDFAALPPEVNSGRMHAGPGAGSLSLAAAGWDRLAIELRSAADAYSTVISGLTTQWLGPSAEAMARSAIPYAVWLAQTAAQAELTAAQARDAVAAYQTAMSLIVPPVDIAANRARLATLRATNIIGQNATAIALAEVQYAEMWAQDAGAMYAYSAQSAAAAPVTPFAPPPRNSDGALGQPAAAPTAASDPASIFAPGSPLSTLLEAYEFGGPILLPARNALASSTIGMGLAARNIQTGLLPVAVAPPAAGLSGASPASSTGGTASGVLANVGARGLVGRLSVPPSWAAATPTIRLAAAALRDIPGAVVVPAGGSVFSQMAAAGLVGGAMGAAIPRVAGPQQAAGESTESPKDVGGSATGKRDDKLKRVLAELSEKPESVQHWHTDKAHLDDLLEQLSTKPGVHAVHVSSKKPNRNRPSWG